MLDTRPIRFGHSPDPDDAFMYYPLATGAVDTEGLVFEQVLEDIESLNRRALAGELETTAASVHACAYLASRYAVLPCGASMGDGYGPIVVARRPMHLEDLPGATIAVPGLRTSAYLALRLAAGEIRHVVVPFDRIPAAVVSGQAEAGLLIHEGQLTYAREGLHRVVDLGAWWAERTDGLPLPLGVNIVRRDLGDAVMGAIGRSLRRAIDHSLQHRGAALGYASGYARGLDPALTDRFVSMYVNELTRDCGDRGRRAIRRFLEEGRRHAVIDAPSEPEPSFVEL
ncbi:MAG TPA: MqnA/MqnD/SBP family protein [Candidatus Polarisedimenticolia bacterium]|nr:MqnA/MqnD/SBP family protein [Candidatus Polarisedimenticolia bacterium]